MSRILGLTRYIVLLGAVASMLLAIALFVAALAHAVELIGEAVATFGNGKAAKLLAIASIDLVDLCLIATALYLVGIGLYELFIGEVRLPDWLIINTLDDLKGKLINVVIVALAVSFLAQAATWDGKTDLLPFGVAIGVVILALTAFGFLRLGKNDHRPVRANDDGRMDMADEPARRAYDMHEAERKIAGE